jgi:hypothetical protein
MIMISFAAFFISRFRSLMLSNAIALMSIPECLVIGYQIYQAYNFSTNYVVIYYASLGVACILYSANLLFIIYYCARMQTKDMSFTYWRQKHFCVTVIILFLSLVINFKLFRLLYSRFFGIKLFSANISDTHNFTK